MKFFLTVCNFVVLGIADSSNVRVPLAGAWQLRLQINGFDFRTGVPHSMVLSNTGIHFDTVFRIGNHDGYVIELGESELIPIGGNPARIDVVRELVPVIGPVAIHQPDDGLFDLILNSTEENFSSSCIPHSILVATFSPSNSIAITVSLGDVVSHAAFRVDYIFGDMGGVPARIFDSIVAILISNGAIRGSFREFSNCGPEQIASLPQIEYLLDNGGRLVFTPEDYFDVDHRTNTCELQITRCDPSAGENCTIHPLALDRMNIRISPNHTIAFCDSI